MGWSPGFHPGDGGIVTHWQHQFNKKIMKYIAFLDIDGVFTSTRVQLASLNHMSIWDTFDPIAINFMNRLHHQIDDISFVLISTWKNGLDRHDVFLSHWVQSAFRNAGFDGQLGDPWKTNPENATHFTNRAFEIKNYLEKHSPQNKDYIIFDDNDYAFERVLGRKRLIKTNGDDGLLHKHMLNALALVGTWDKK